VERVRNQAKEMFPTVYLTLLSMVQALALEVLWSAVNGQDHLWARSATALTGWLQAVAMFQMIFFVWVGYAHVVMQFRWVVSVRDSMIPFIIGIAEFALIGLILPGKLHLWFYGLAATTAFGAWVNLSVLRNASAEPENTDVVALIGTPGRPYYPTPLIGCAVFGLLAGIVAQLCAGSEPVLLALIGAANLVLVVLNLWSARRWRRALEE
jgi:hypothetical protein